MAAVPDWIDLRALSAINAYGYGRPIPAGSAPAIRKAARLHVAAMAPSSAEERYEILMGLRSATIIRDEDAREAEGAQKLLLAHLADVPVDILREACRAYCNASGRRFFPRSAGELRAFTNPLMFERQARAQHLSRLAEEAERGDRERDREAERLSPDQVRAGFAKVMANLSGSSLSVQLDQESKP